MILFFSQLFGIKSCSTIPVSPTDFHQENGWKKLESLTLQILIRQPLLIKVLSNKECYGMEDRNRWEISVGLVVTIKIN